MKKIFINTFYAVAICFTIFSCEESLVIYEGDSKAQFVGDGSGIMTINPSEDTKNVFYVGVTSATSQNRQFTISVDPASTLDPSYYAITSDVGTIPAGEVVGAIEITTFATLDFPVSGSQLILNLESVEGTDFMNQGDTVMALDFLVACAFDADESSGDYAIVVDDFETSVGDEFFEVIPGPGENQITLVSPFDHTNPDTGEEDYKIVIDVDPNTGAAEVAKQAAWHCDNFGCPYGEGRVEGTGYVFSCLGSMQFNFRHTVDAGSFGTYEFQAEKQ